MKSVTTGMWKGLWLDIVINLAVAGFGGVLAVLAVYAATAVIGEPDKSVASVLAFLTGVSATLMWHALAIRRERKKQDAELQDLRERTEVQLRHALAEAERAEAVARATAKDLADAKRHTY